MKKVKHILNIFFITGLILFLSGSPFQLNAQSNFIPSNIVGLKLWLMGDSVQTSNPPFVNECYDQSSSTNNALQLVAGFQPVSVDAILNGHKIIRFDGIDDLIQFNEIADIRTVFFVIKENPLAATTYKALLGHSASYDFHRGNVKEFWGLGNTSSAITSGVTKVNGTAVDGLAKNVPTDFSIISVMTTGNVKADNFTNDRLLSGRTWDGDLAELIVYNKLLIATEIEQVEKYLHVKYAPPISLGADIIIPYGFCNKQLDAAGGFKSYLWSTGEITQQILVKKPGTYWVQGIDRFDGLSTDTIKITYPSMNYSGGNILCAASSKTWDTKLSKKAYTFKWQDNSTDSIFTITQAGKYYVKITDSLGCALMSDTATITVDNIASVISLGNDTTFCSGNSIYLKKGASQAVSYLWSTNSTNDSLIIKTSGKYWLTVKSVNNCSATDTINVIISGSAPTANFSNTSGVCVGKSMQFNDLSTAAAGNTIISWAWDFGDSQTATQQNPIHIYSDTGSYKVILNIITDGGCSNQFSKIVRVYPYPQLTIFTSNACEQSRVQFSNTLLAFGYPITKWAWNFGDPSSGGNNSSSLQNPTHLYTAQGNYQAQLIVENSFGCADTAITALTIKPKPTADFNYSFACKNDSVQFTNSSLLPPATSLQKTYWSFGDNTTSLLIKPKHKYSSAVSYHASLIVTASNGCSDTARKTITVNDNPIAYFSTSNACVNSPVNFNDFSVISNGTIANWLWEIDSMMLSNLKDPSYTFTKVGNANVQLEVTSDKGCKNKTNKTIVIHPAPVASFFLTPSYGNPPFAVNFTNTSNGTLSYVWNFGDGNTSTTQNPTNTFKDTGSFKITLTIKNNLGCVSEVSKTVNSLKKIIDVKVQDISAVIKNDFLNITVQLVNKGTVDITKLDLYIKVNDGPEVKEEWSGLLLKGGALVHTFKASVNLKDDNHYVCVTAENPNGSADENPSNNKLCKGINVNAFQVFELYPNPAKEAISVTLPLVIPKKELLTISIYDSNGKFVKTAFSEVLTEGLQLVNISVIGLKSGLYACKIEYRKESAIKKIMLY